MSNIAVLTNCASRKEARQIAQALVDARLAACVNLGAHVKSFYRWKGKVETAKEVPVMIKTTRARFKAVEKTIRELHSYDVPEIIALPIVAGSKNYLSWLAQSVAEKK
jgi:periplasmic divalent cation tolerance protein